MTQPTIAKDTPLAEITLRKYEKPQTFTGRELVRKLCLTLGLLQPGDSRDVVVDVLHVMLMEKNALSSKEVEKKVIENRNNHGVPLLGIAPSNIRRQLLRCRELFLIEKVKSTYRITENSLFTEIFAEKLERYYLQSILDRTREYMQRIDEEFLS
ncbi:hypothetical protein K9M74_04120 [Candidatus Woesearchaeota archaeon]|nr:hypothetical protein [Candidatus Woesearchaeota archaeon]